MLYVQIVRQVGFRTNFSKTDLSNILDRELELQLREVSEVSMGTDIAEEDIESIHQCCDQVLELNTYKASLLQYLQDRMNAIAPNLTMMVGELVGARLISHAGSLIN
uniref:Nucleolar protein 58 n=1 Tax=Lygus hesperus TaxID=30085 RepID=A0A0A9YC69_LYGHE